MKLHNQEIEISLRLLGEQKRMGQWVRVLWRDDLIVEWMCDTKECVRCYKESLRCLHDVLVFSFQMGKGYSDEAALILHRKVFDCQLSSRAMGLPCSTTQGKMSIPKLFNNFAVESFIPSSLSLMHSPPDAQNTSEVSLSPMEISTSRIRLRWTWPSGWVEKLWFGYLPWFLTCNN